MFVLYVWVCESLKLGEIEDGDWYVAYGEVEWWLVLVVGRVYFWFGLIFVGFVWFGLAWVVLVWWLIYMLVCIYCWYWLIR